MESVISEFVGDLTNYEKCPSQFRSANVSIVKTSITESETVNKHVNRKGADMQHRPRSCQFHRFSCIAQRLFSVSGTQTSWGSRHEL
jgi:hypothetical protein